MDHLTSEGGEEDLVSQALATGLPPGAANSRRRGDASAGFDRTSVLVLALAALAILGPLLLLLLS